MTEETPPPNPSGLTSDEARARLRRYGPNVLPVLGGEPIWRRLARQFVHFFALMLWVAAGLALFAGLPQLAIAIAIVILINGAFAFAQEYRADRAVEHVRSLIPRRATVVRDGARREVDAAGLVPGDLVSLGGGDGISADLRVLEARSLLIDTSTMTGESAPDAVDAGGTVDAGTFVLEGEGLAVVERTGRQTRFAALARLTTSGDRPTPPLAVELKRLVRAISVIALSVGAVCYGAALFLGIPPISGLVFGVGVTVALVPEALLPTVTLSLALAAQRMARRHALVRRLESVETLGSTTFICTDKTGTLTRNEMAVVEVWTRAGSLTVEPTGYDAGARIEPPAAMLPAVRATAIAASRTSTGRVAKVGERWVAVGDPMEAAFHVLALRAGVDLDRTVADIPERARFPFDPRRRRMSVVAGDEVLVKGAPDAVLPLCADAAEASSAVDRMAARGLRVMAVAHRALAEAEGGVPGNAADAERGLRVLGVLGLEDPPRPEAAAALSVCRRAGIKVAMVTGDHPATAAAIAREVGLSGGRPQVLVGDDLPTDTERLGALLDHDGVVVARADPEHKVLIARALRARGHVVAMTGDGVNDGPALHEADIGVAMGRSGTDVAREAADLVLLDDNFATIVAAVGHGRAVFANARRFLTYHLTDNVAEVTPFIVWALSGGTIPLALGVLQILALDIGTDTLSAVALGAERPATNVLDRGPARGRLLDAAVARRAFGLMGPLEAALTMLAFFGTMVVAGWRPGAAFPGGDVLLMASGASFATVVIAQTANAFACRSTTKWPGALGWFTNPLLVAGSAVELVIAAACLFVPALASALGHLSPGLAGWAVALASAPIVLAVDAASKRLRRRPVSARATTGRAHAPA